MTSKHEPGERSGRNSVEVSGRRVRVSNLDKVLYPKAGATKRDVIAYYDAIASTMLPHIAGRPITRKRWPSGVDKEPFFEKQLGAGAPEWVRRRTIKHSDRTVSYPVAESAADLVWLAQLAALELHVPQWYFGPRGGRHHPDRLVIDLDPGPGTGLRECADVARRIRDTLGKFGERLVPVTSGSKGLHLYLGLNESMSSDQVSSWAKELADTVQRADPDLVITRMSRSERRGKVFIDWSQNSGSKTTVAPYSLRGTARPMVAAPRTWDELDDARLAQLEYREVLERLGDIGDPMAELGHSIKAPPRSRPASRDRLEVYRSKRDAQRTPEPVPDEPSSSRTAARSSSRTRGRGADNTFVIQEHHARRLHWDFRLERDGVLVSWAVPKGVPDQPDENRLAVQTEDHPLDYAAFAGTIPRGEYGAGKVEIWDAGTYVAEKWRDDEIIADLSGKRVRGRYALIRTKDDQWLLHLMKDQQHAPDHVASRGSAQPPRAVEPMLATLGSEADAAGSGWQFEGKWDGIRAVITVDADVEPAVTVRSRAGNDLTVAYPEMGELAAALEGHRAVLDGEIVALGPSGAPSFSLLQRRMGLRQARDVAKAADSTAASFYAFDLLYLDGVILTGKPLRDRRRLLERLGINTTHCSVPALLPSTVTGALRASRQRGLEGIVAKRTDSVYRAGQRPGTWVKVKFRATQDVVVIGWRPGNGSRADSIGSLLLAVSGARGLEYVGRVGTGFTMAELEKLASVLKPLRRKTPSAVSGIPQADARDAVWVTPKLVGEVVFAEWTPDGRLRQAAWRGLRPERSPAEVQRES